MNNENCFKKISDPHFYCFRCFFYKQCGSKYGSLSFAPIFVYIILNFIVKPYLILYNLAQLCGWSVALFNFGQGFSASGFNTHASQWTGDTAAYITFFQWLMLYAAVFSFFFFVFFMEMFSTCRSDAASKGKRFFESRSTSPVSRQNARRKNFVVGLTLQSPRRRWLTNFVISQPGSSVF